jgi:hypothetical protein
MLTARQWVKPCYGGAVVGRFVLVEIEVGCGGVLCRDGWLDYIDADHPRPCPICRPWLTDWRVRPPVPRRQRARR